MKLTDPNGYLHYYNMSTWFFLPMAVYGESESWFIASPITCRETFGSYFTNQTKLVGYYHTGFNADSIKRFIGYWRQIEALLELGPCVIHESLMTNTILIEVDPFWTINNTRRGFFSLLLRMGIVFFSTDIPQAIKDYPLAAVIPNTIAHFLSGHTTPTYEELEFGGLVNFYQSKDSNPEELKLRLVKLITK